MKFLFVVLCCLNALIPLQAQQVTFRSWSVYEGLPQASLYTIYQDNQGFLWFGTQGGVARFDGIHFKTLSQKSGLAENHVTAIAQISDKIFWFGHRYDGISVSINDSVFALKNQPGNLNSQVNALHFHQNKIFCGSQENGLFIIDPEAGPDSAHAFSQHLDSLDIYDFFAPSEGNLWVLSSDGIYQIDSDHKISALNHPHSALNHSVYDIAEGPSNTLWISTSSGIFHFSREKGIPAPQPLRQIPPDPAGNAASKLTIDREGRIWFTRNTGAGRIDRDGLRYFTSANGLSDSETNSILTDHEGNVWIGLMGEGARQFTGDAFENWDATTGLPDNVVQAIAIDSSNNAWIGSEKGVTIIKPNGSASPFSQLPGEISVNALFHDSRGNTWIGTDQGVYVWENKFSRLSYYSASQGLAGNRVVSIGEDKNGDVWLAGLGQGCTRIRMDEAGKPVSFEVFNKSTGFPTNAVWKIFRDSGGILWFGTNDAGLVRFDGNEFKTINEKQGLPHNRPGSITEDPQGNLWLGTIGGGVVKYNTSSGTFKSFTTAEGIGSDNPYLVISDLSGNIWVGTNYGTDRIDVEERISHFGKAEGFTGVETNQNAAALDHSGNVWFGTIKGVIRCNPARLTGNPVPPVVHLTGIRVYLKEAEQEEQFSHERNHITFDFVGLSYSNPEEVRYRYMLEGFDEEWQPATIARFATYANLPPGQYTFRVEAANKDGVWSRADSGYSFSILPPFWQTAWFLILTGIGLISLIYIVFLVRTRNLRRSKHQLEHLVSQRTRELREEKEKVERVNREVIMQKEIIELKNKDITASITYAKRIQEAILPPVDSGAQPGDLFVMYRPKDIVSGDFYWLHHSAGNPYHETILAVGDCTGHGVPGALMSMMGNDILHAIVREQQVSDPGEILNKLDERIRQMLRHDEAGLYSGEGMDIGIVTIRNFEGAAHPEIRFAGAFRPVWTISGGELNETRGNKSSIGGYKEADRTFSSQKINLSKGDMLYLFSDGFADQFGGENGKKLMTRNFKSLLCSIHLLETSRQKEKLETFFDAWKGNLDQVDDVCVMGLRL